ncbi:MAG: hypothetical protein ACE5J7_01225 [Candidatus Aenigmatarchaeota archaeon]
MVRFLEGYEAAVEIFSGFNPCFQGRSRKGKDIRARVYHPKSRANIEISLESLSRFEAEQIISKYTKHYNYHDRLFFFKEELLAYSAILELLEANRVKEADCYEELRDLHELRWIDA